MDKDEIIALYKDFYDWLRDEAFGEEQFQILLNEYRKDRKMN